MMRIAENANTSQRYVVDRERSRFTVQAFAGGMLAALGHNPKFVARNLAGEVTFDPTAPQKASVTLRMRARELTLVDDLSERDRATILHTMHDQVLESTRHPEIVYRCDKASLHEVGAGQFDVTLDGELTLHGVTRVQRIPARLDATAATLRAVGEFTVRQSDYAIEPVAIAGSMLKIKNELECTFDIVARR